MRGGVHKSGARRSRLRLSKASEENRLDVTTSKTSELPQPLCPVSTNDCSPAKRARLKRTDTPLRAASGLQVETEAGTTTLERPELTREQEQVSPTTLLRKRQIDSNGDDNEHHLKRARLTRKNLAAFDRMAKKKGTTKTSASAPPESAIESSSTTTSGFAVQARKNGILNPLSSKAPENLEDIRRRYAQSRETASPTESVYEDYVNTVGGACNEATMVFEVGGQLLKKYSREGYQRAFNQAFTGFPKDVGFNNGLSAPQPDYVEGLRTEEYDPFPVDEHISGSVLYKDDPLSLTLPHLAGEWKGRGKDMEEARMQSAYDGAALVYARNQALSYLGKSDPPGHAEVTTFTTDGTNLNLFAHYAAPSEDGTLRYHQYPIKSTNLIDSHQGLKDGRRGLRNEQEQARKQSYILRDQLKEHWKQRRSGLYPIAEVAPLPLPDGTLEETKVYEDEAGYEIVEQSCQPTPAASSISPKESSPIPSSKSLPSTNDYVSGRGDQRRKASLSSQISSHELPRHKSKWKNYWKWDAGRGQCFHKHSDGRVTWLEDSDDEN
ncbi:hypothetical protein F4680DRAFT_94078 [Xylaria scruposa]|nr:hypothetical protein F4680DRAFT_94078 [Xylaria scruposa]